MKLAAEKKKFKFKATQLSSSSSPIADRVFTAAGNSGRPDATAEPQEPAVERASDKACGKLKALLDDRTRQLLVQLTLKDKRCPPLPCNSKDLLHQVTKAKFDCEDPSYSEEEEVDAWRAKAASAFRKKTGARKKALRLHRLEWAPPRHDNNFWNCGAQEDAWRQHQWN